MSSFTFTYEIEALDLKIPCVANFTKGGGEWEVYSVTLDMVKVGDPLGDCIAEKLAEQIKQPYLQGLLIERAEELAADDGTLLETGDYYRK